MTMFLYRVCIIFAHYLKGFLFFNFNLMSQQGFNQVFVNFSLGRTDFQLFMNQKGYMELYRAEINMEYNHKVTL